MNIGRESVDQKGQKIVLELLEQAEKYGAMYQDQGTFSHPRMNATNTLS